MTPLNRRKALTVVAAAPAAVALGTSSARAEDVGEDAELKRLWADYLAQLAVYLKADAAHSEKREVLEADLGPLPRGGWGRGAFERAAKRCGYDSVNEAWNREARKLRPIVKAIRKAKAETMFGVGVKLSVIEGLDDASEQDFAEAIEDARRAIAALIGVDFIAATGPVWEGLS